MKYFFISLTFCCLVISSCNKKQTDINPSNITFYPNPFQDQVHVNINAQNSYDVVFLGSENKELNHITGVGANSYTLNFSGNDDEVILAEIEIDGVKSVQQLYRLK